MRSLRKVIIGSSLCHSMRHAPCSLPDLTILTGHVLSFLDVGAGFEVTTTTTTTPDPTLVRKDRVRVWVGVEVRKGR